MPKNSRCRSARRKPLADVSNSGKASRTRKKEAPRDDGDGGGRLRDRLLLARADLSRLANQIDGLVMQALEHKLANEKGRQETECFMHTLSEMHSSLRSWVPRLQQAFGSSVITTEKHFEPCLTDKSHSAIDRERTILSCPNELDQDLIVSPSPLVSWRHGACAVESGRQLFLLTPLQKSKALAPKSSRSPKSLLGGINNKHSSCSTSGLPALSNSPGSTCDVLAEKRGVVPTPNKFLLSRTRVSASTLDTGFVSPKQTSNCEDKFIYCLTPCLKTPAPKTCLLLDSIPESFPEDNKVTCNASPWITRTQKHNACEILNNSNSNECSDNSSSDEVSKTLASKYADLFGLHPLTTQRKDVEESLHWFLSPPKTCILMEPSDEKLLLASGRDKHPLNSALKTLSLAVPEDTPMWKHFENATENGKNAGEATLKRELWAKFEAVSANSLRFDPSIFQQLSNKRLIDMLEDVS